MKLSMIVWIWHLHFVSLVTLEELCENFEHQEKYDGIIASEVLEHVNNVESFIGNIHKLLKVKIISHQ